MAKDKYEISLWQDEVVPTEGGGTHFEEEKLCVIGSDSMTSNCRAFEPRLIENTNGTNTFTFKMFYVYSEPGEEGKILDNPFLKLLVNERKVKVKWKGKWYHMVIKNIQEDTNGKSITYTCKDQYINELSKNGFNLEFDTELKNNTGTAPELAAAVLEGTDWKLNSENDAIKQEVEEPVYEATLTNAVTAQNETTSSSASVSIPSDKRILLFYSQIQNIMVSDQTSGTVELQFAYTTDPAYETDGSSQLVINADCYRASEVKWKKTDTQITFTQGEGQSPFYTFNYNSQTATSISSNYRANRLVKTQKTIADPLVGRTVKVYQRNVGGKIHTVYGYQETLYRDATFVNNLVVNSKNFVGLDGWSGWSSDNMGYFVPYPVSDQSLDTPSKSYLLFPKAVTLFNKGISQSSSYIPEGIQNGETYIFRIKARESTGSGNDRKPTNTYIAGNRFIPQVRKYDPQSSPIKPVSGGTSYFNSTYINTTDNWIQYRLKCTTSFTRADVYSKYIGLFIKNNSGKDLWIEDVEFFKEIAISENRFIEPGNFDTNSLVNVCYSYYDVEENQGVTSKENIHFLWRNTADITETLTPIYPTDPYEKVRSISIKESNRFNILQEIAETFECWIKFDIECDVKTGRPIYKNGSPNKVVTIVKEIGQETGIGFKYGIDLKGISRTIQSNQIVTKTIVPQNSNEFAKNGFCTIARSDENYSKENFILNFDYYVTHQLIDGGQLYNDLYSSYSEDLGYYYKLRQKNTAYDTNAEQLANQQLELTKQEGYLKTYTEYLSSIDQEITSLNAQITQLAGNSSNKIISAAIKKVEKDPTNPLWIAYQTLTATKGNKKAYEKIVKSLEASVKALTNSINTLEAAQEVLLEDINEIHEKFYKKYSTFLQEGTWKSDEYVDDDLYYLDGLSVAYTSSRPRISYNITVARITNALIAGEQLFKNKIFKLGDISFIEDVEFFGYEPTTVGGIRTPYHERVLISEITSNFDDPSQDSFKVQNYKTQFEDLFQRITATTQSLQYSSGSYAKVASIINEDGTIKGSTFQASLAANQNLVIAAQNETIVQDSTGLMVVNASNPQERTKVTSGGVFISNDGGATWTSAVRSDGVSGSVITSGLINTSAVKIIGFNSNGLPFSPFSWDKFGISAYTINTVNGGEAWGVNRGQFVRFDQHGIYGVDSGLQDLSDPGFIPVTEREIWENPGTKFALTRTGFLLKNTDGSVRITTDEDIRVLDSGQDERIKIGRLYESNEYVAVDTSEVTKPTLETTYYTYDETDRSYKVWYPSDFNFNDNIYYSNPPGAITTASDSPTYVSVYGLNEENFISNRYYVVSEGTYTIATDFTSNTSYYDLASYESTPVDNVDYYTISEDYTWLSGAVSSESWAYNHYYSSEAGELVTSWSSTVQNYYSMSVSFSKANLLSFESGVTYYTQSVSEEETISYEETSETKPNPSTTYYIYDEETQTYIPAELDRNFESGVTYYTFTPTARLHPDITRDYYYSSDNSQTINHWQRNQFTWPSDQTIYTKSRYTYGIRITDDRNKVVMETIDDGTLWLKSALHISDTGDGNYNIAVGYLDKTKTVVRESGEVEVIHEVFNANDKFVVYEDGSMAAIDGTFSGTLTAATGVFRGTVYAEDGRLGSAGIGDVEINENGLTIVNNGLQIISKTLQDDVDYYTIASEISLNKETGYTYAFLNNEIGMYEQFSEESFHYIAADVGERMFKPYEYYVTDQSNSYYNTSVSYATDETYYVLNALEGTYDSTESWYYRELVSDVSAPSGYYYNYTLQTEETTETVYRLTVTVADVGAEAFEEGKYCYNTNTINGYEKATVYSSDETYYYLPQYYEVTSYTDGVYINDRDLYYKSSTTITSGGSTETVYIYAVESGSPRQVLSYNTVKNELNIYGSGTFTGTIRADDGDIGGFIIKDYGLYSTAGINCSIYYIKDDSGDTYTNAPEEYDASTQYYKQISVDPLAYEEVDPLEELSPVQLLGNEGRIKANNIEIGTGAKITGFINIGDNVVLQNPDLNTDGKFLTVTNNNVETLSITQDGILNIGNIKIDGETSTIAGGEQWGFSISPEIAKFNHAIISGTLETSVFKKNSVQTVGGAMLFKSASKVNRVEQVENNLKLYLENELEIEGYTGNPPYYCTIIGTDGSQLVENPIAIVSYETTESNDVILTIPAEGLEGKIDDATSIGMVMLIGQDEDLVIGVNSTNADILKLVKSRSLTMTEFNKHYYDKVDKTITPTPESGITYYTLDSSGIYEACDTGMSEFEQEVTYYIFRKENDIRLILGDLSTLKRDDLSGYGLYSDNVYLNGSLITQTPKSSSSGETIHYAGINTISEVVSSQFDQEKDNEIIFWGGSIGLTTENIQNAPFQVTKSGNLYARSGIFEGVIITRSSIRGADIYTARIHGTGPEGNGLEFYDLNNGFVFYADESYVQVALPTDPEAPMPPPDSSIIYYTGNTDDGFESHTSLSEFEKGVTYYTLSGTPIWSADNIGLAIAASTSTKDYFISLDTDIATFHGKGAFSSMTVGSSNYWLDVTPAFDTSTSTSLINLIYTDNLGTEGQLRLGAAIQYSASEIKLKSSTNEVTVNNDKIINTGNVTITNNLSLNDILQYKQVEGGYDLYVTEIVNDTSTENTSTENENTEEEITN